MSKTSENSENASHGGREHNGISEIMSWDAAYVQFLVPLYLGQAVQVATPQFPERLQWRKRIVLPADASSRLSSAGISASPDNADSSSTGLSKDLERANWWRRIANDAECGARKMVAGTRAQIETIRAIGVDAPNFDPLIGIIVRALQAAVATGTPLRLPPILLLGPPGAGKTYVARQIAAALDTSFMPIDMTTATGLNILGGTDIIWRSPKIGRIAEALIMGKTASPMLLLDELDKCFAQQSDSDPLAPLHALLEPSSAREFRDDYLEMNVAADAVFWLATANGTASIAPSILDRMLVLPVSSPSPDQMRAVLASMYKAVIASYGHWFDPALAPGVMAYLVAVHPRRVKRLLDLACMAAASRHARELTREDVDIAQALFENPARRPRVGFLG